MNAPVRRQSLRIAAKSASPSISSASSMTTRSFGKQQRIGATNTTTNTIRRSSRLAALPRVSYAGMDGDAEDSI